MKTKFFLLGALALCAAQGFAYTVTDNCTGTTSCSLVGTHAATDLVFVFAFRAGSTTAPTNGSGMTSIQTGNSATGASRSWRYSCEIAGTTGTVAVPAFTNATNIAAISVSGSGATTTGNCRTAGVGSLGTPNSVSSATATFSALSASGSPAATSTMLLLMGSTTSGQTCMPATGTSKASTGDVNLGIANANGSWSTATCSITSSVTTEIVVELIAPVLAAPTYGSPTGTYTAAVSETITCGGG